MGYFSPHTIQKRKAINYTFTNYNKQFKKDRIDKRSYILLQQQMIILLVISIRLVLVKP